MMQKSYYEDIFTTFFEAVLHTNFDWLHTDYSGARSFYASIQAGKALTAKQGQYLIRILEKYKLSAKLHGIDYEKDLKTAVWRERFRELDLTKRVSVEKDSNGKLWVAFKFPYQIKEKFEKEFVDQSRRPVAHPWDPERRIRLAPFYQLNLVRVHEFALENGIELDDTFLFALSEVEQIWQSQESINPHCVIDNTVSIVNASETAKEWWTLNSNGNIIHDILLAKHMGFKLSLTSSPKTAIEKIGSSATNNFWTNDLGTILEIYKNINGKIAILIDRTENSLDWLKNFVNQANYYGVTNNEIRVCFRASNKENPAINQWIKDSNLGGKVEDGKILIFQHQPPKWLFSEQENVKLIVTNLLHPPTNVKTQDWLKSHPCVIYLGDIKASMLRNQNIVNL